jgi:hypothetical protein
MCCRASLDVETGFDTEDEISCATYSATGATSCRHVSEVSQSLVAMRHGALISRAAQDNAVSQRTMKRYVGSALLQSRPGGRIRATKNDRLVRYLQIPGPNGPIDITAHGSKEATELARYKAAVNRLLGGDLNALAPWDGKKIAGVELITAGSTLKELAQKELLPYSLYRSLSGGAA